MPYDQDKKRALLAEWFDPFMDTHSVRILASGVPLDPVSATKRIHELTGGQPGPAIYALFIQGQGEWVPVYIGKSEDVASRWEGHISGLIKGQGTYRRWRTLLLDSVELCRYDALLLVIPQSAIAYPPIPDFPTSVGSVEYQLIGLASDAYPDAFLNREGNRR